MSWILGKVPGEGPTGAETRAGGAPADERVRIRHVPENFIEEWRTVLAARTVSCGMTATSPVLGAGEVCRLIIYGPTSRIELAVPVQVPVADLLPTVLGHLDPALSNTGLEHDGWVLQKLGEPPLRPDRGTAALGLYDGDILYLRPRNDQLPPVAFDDLVDGVATGINGRDDKWVPRITKVTFSGLALVALATLALLTPLVGAGDRVVQVAALCAVLLMIAAVLMSRAFGDPTASQVLGVAAVAFMAIAGFAAPWYGRDISGLPGLLSAPGLFAGGACAIVVALACRFTLGGGHHLFTGIAVAGTLATLGGALSSLLDVSGAGAAAVVLCVLFLLTRLIPMLSAHLAGIHLKPLPDTPEELQEDIDPEPSSVVIDRTATADAYMTTLCMAIGAIAAGCLAVLVASGAWQGGWASHTLAAVASVTLLLHGYEFVSARQRLASMVPGFFGVTLLVMAQFVALPQYRPLLAAGLLLLAGLCYVAARTLPGHKLVPNWGRIGTLLHWLTAMAMLPLTLAVLELYARVRAGWS